MKPLKTMTLAVLAMFLMNFTMASEKDHDLVQKQISFFKSDLAEHIIYPEQAFKQMIEGSVATSLKITDNGKVIITGINGHPVLVNSLKKQLENIQLSPFSLISGEEILLKINFEIE
ncbi:MAG: hypothetical protein JEZ09_09875 [Salinivirgaceae bacterium]|nr:hypothetical protein [Salinivirgaceae bacterium]